MPIHNRQQNNALHNSNAKTKNMHFAIRWMALVLLLLVGGAKAQNTYNNPHTILPRIDYQDTIIPIVQNNYWLKFNASYQSISFAFTNLSDNVNTNLTTVEIFEEGDVTTPIHVETMSIYETSIFSYHNDYAIDQNYYLKLTKSGTSNINVKIDYLTFTPQNSSSQIGCPPGCINKSFDFNSGLNGWSTMGWNATTVFLSDGSLFLNLRSSDSGQNFNMAQSSPINVCAGEKYALCFSYKNPNIGPANAIPKIRVLINGIAVGDFQINQNQGDATLQAICYWTAPLNISTATITFRSNLAPAYPGPADPTVLNSPIINFGVNCYENMQDVKGGDILIDNINLTSSNNISFKVNNTNVNPNNIILGACKDDNISISSWINDIQTNASNPYSCLYQHSTSLSGPYSLLTSTSANGQFSYNYTVPCDGLVHYFKPIKKCTLDNCPSNFLPSFGVIGLPKPTITSSSQISCGTNYPTLTASISGCSAPQGYTFRYTWRNAAGNIVGNTPSATNLTFIPTISGDYTVEVTLVAQNNVAIDGKCISQPQNVNILPVCQCDYNNTTYDAGFQSGTFNVGGGVAGTMVTWTTNKRINNTVMVGPGVTLNIIGATLEFGPNGKIIVARGNISGTGGTLNLRTATLTGTSNSMGWSGCMWQGIEVWGWPANFNVSSSAKGKLYSTSETKIEHAKTGIFVGNSQALATHSGGHIEVTDTKFNNNYVSIWFDKNPGAENFCRLTNSEFNCSNTVRQPAYCDPNYATTNPSGRSRHFVILDETFTVTNIFLNTCGFRNISSPSSPASSNLTTAVLATNSNFIVSNCVFDFVENGVTANELSATNQRVAKVVCSNFSNVKRGILFTNTSGRSEVLKCKFTSGIPTTLTPVVRRNAAIVFDNLDFGANADNNQITGYEQGIITFNCSGSNVNIKNNRIFHTSFNTSNTCIALGGNNSGVKVNCNQLVLNTQANYNRGISVVGWNAITGSGNTSASSTNVALTGTFGNGLMAGNLFDNLTFGQRYDVFSNTGIPLPYYYAPSPANAIPMPVMGVTSIISPSGNCASLAPSVTVTGTSCGAPYAFLAPPPPVTTQPDDNLSERSAEDVIYDMEQTTDINILEALEAELMKILAENSDVTAEIAYYESIGDLEAQRKLLALYIEKAMSNEAIQKMMAIPNDNIENISYKEYYQIMLDLLMQNRNLEQLTQTEDEMLQILKELEVSASANSYAVLEKLYQEEYEITCSKLDMCDDEQVAGRFAAKPNYNDMFLQAQTNLKMERVAKEKQGIATSLNLQSKISLIPNPANTNSNINVFVPNEAKVANITITSVDGKVLQTIPLSNGNNNKLINVSEFAKGIYFVCLSIDDAKKDCKKLIVN